MCRSGSDANALAIRIKQNRIGASHCERQHDGGCRFAPPRDRAGAFVRQLAIASTTLAPFTTPLMLRRRRSGWPTLMLTTGTHARTPEAPEDPLVGLAA